MISTKKQFYKHFDFYYQISILAYFRHNDIESISKEYAIEKIELEKALADLTEVERRKADLLEEKRLEEVQSNKKYTFVNSFDYFLFLIFELLSEYINPKKTFTTLLGSRTKRSTHGHSKKCCSKDNSTRMAFI